MNKPFGINHVVIFWGFLVLLMLNAEFLIQGLFPEFSWSFIGEVPYGILLFLTDLMSLLVLAAIVVATARRLFFRPDYIEPTADAFIILFLIAALMVAYFGMHTGEIIQGEAEWGSWMPVSTALASMLASMDASSAAVLTKVSWWIHAVVLLAFMNYLPYSKHLHVITALPNVFFRNFDFVRTVPRMEFELGNSFGTSSVVQNSWKSLLDFMSCTECGRCQAACPAAGTGKMLNPREIIHKGKLNLFRNGESLLSSRPVDTLIADFDTSELKVPYINGVAESFHEEELWDCTTCGACMANCPVFIEHIPKIVEARRSLVMENAKFPEELLNFFNNMEQRFNPWGIAPSDRMKWAQDLNIRVVDEEHPAEYLFFVGCSGAFDSRNRSVVVAMAKIMDAAGLDWGVLGTAEKCCGDSLRRLGNEYVFDQIARQNIESMENCGVKKIVTHCPHCYSTLKNDYAQYGAEFEVIHHSELLEQLLKEKRLQVNQPGQGATVYHDSCYLGRYNEVYQAPRTVLQTVNGKEPLEMPRHGRESFCCGAGGGRMWLEETRGRKIFIERTKEAMECHPDTIAVACPFCMTMFEDGLKDLNSEDRVKVKDLAEIIGESIS